MSTQSTTAAERARQHSPFTLAADGGVLERPDGITPSGLATSVTWIRGYIEGRRKRGVPVEGMEPSTAEATLLRGRAAA